MNGYLTSCFAEVIVNDNQDTYVNYRSLQQYRRVDIQSVPSRITKDNNRIIGEAWDLYDRGDINAIQLAWRVKYRTGAGKDFPSRL